MSMISSSTPSYIAELIRDEFKTLEERIQGNIEEQIENEVYKLLGDKKEATSIIAESLSENFDKLDMDIFIASLRLSEFHHDKNSERLVGRMLIKIIMDYFESIAVYKLRQLDL